MILRPDDATRVADAIVRVFIEHGDRTNRQKARLKYLLDSWGFEKFMAEVERKLGAPLQKLDTSFVAPRPAADRHGHIGVHRQKQPGLNWIGVVLPVGRLTVEQMRALAAIAQELGDGDIRLTVWQNLLLSGVPDATLDAAKARIEAAGLGWKTTAVGAGLVACTGNRGCKFAASDTKGHALAIARHLDPILDLDQPVNIHLTGCHHSCAQHYIGDIGLLAAKVAVGAEGDQVEGYHLHAGGGFGADAAIARLVYSDVPAEKVPRRVEGLLRAYLAHRDSPAESFAAFSRRHEPERLRELAEAALP